jgi:hypothetical protein
MTQAQKTAKAKFKQAIAYRTKTGVSLKEAFAHIYGKKKSAKKVVRKKAVKKRIAGPKDSSAVKRELARKGLKMPHGYTTTKRKRKIGTIKKRKPSEKSVLKSIQHAVKVQKSHMGGISGHALHNIDKELKQIKHLETLIRSNEIAKKNTKDIKAKKAMSNSIKKYKELMKEHKIHITQLKKHI